MNLHGAAPSGRATPKARRNLVTVHLSGHETDPSFVLRKALSGVAPSQLFVFTNDRNALEHICQSLNTLFPQASLAGCTTAGQIGWQGYEDEQAIVIALPATRFAARSILIEDLEDIESQALIDRLVQERIRLSDAHPDKPNGFAFLLVDGLSRREDILAATIAPALGSWPIFGGSSGDGTRFENTYLAHGTSVHKGAAVLTFVRTSLETHVFSLNHLDPTHRKMVVTSADPEQRIVKEINAEPAAREYARMVGKDPDQLDEFIFAAHPIVVRLGETHHVRAIQRVNEKGELVFFAAIDEGMVLNVANPADIASHLDKELNRIKAGRGQSDILACDCILRRMEASQNQATRDVSDVLARNNVVGFSTYGEQIGPLHVNHTMTGVILADPVTPTEPWT